ncbi:chitobiase/beta-hexosaminidase C-terminal domain-containing protein [Halocatena marina]|uniref:chitobiase/beta-hexosaminidase C-terminal domain-containing protein n=1 Tax=Halocatena marina TaxID=2934937 RepID=UPI002231604C|nr:chitobiase/beta-hexosaminidase C-terminal domain-containing protein [Halocatena marina]
MDPLPEPPSGHGRTSERDANGELTDTQAQWFADTRPAEELYDLQEDPHEIENLADDPTHEDVLERLRGALDDWRQRTGDRAAGREAELDMRERVWPDGDQPTTATPTFVPNAPGNRGLEPDNDGGTFEGPMTVKLFCPTQGASLAYTTDDSEDPHWELYSGPIHLDRGERVRLRTKAVRYGYAESDERQAIFEVE